MKRFKELRESLISEAEFSPYGLYNRSIHTDDGVHRLDNRENLGKINAFIENFLSSNTMNPKAKLEQLKVRLNHIGLDFDIRGGLVDEDITSYPVTHYGKVFGYKMDNGAPTGEIGDQDFATEKFGRPLALSIRQTGEGLVDLEGKLHFVGEEEGLGEEALELRLHIDNDEELFESKIAPALENAHDIDGTLRGLIYAVKSAVSDYEMEVTEDDIHAVAESILMDSIDPDEDEEEFEVEVEIESLDDAEELDELKMPKTNKYGEYTSRKVRDATMAGSSRAGERARKQDNKDYAAYLSGKKPDGGKARRHNDRSINRLNRLVNTKARDAEKREKDRAAAEKGREKVGAGKRRRG